MTFFFFFFASLGAECAELIFCHGAIILVTQYEIGLAQGEGCLVFPTRSYWR